MNSCSANLIEDFGANIVYIKKKTVFLFFYMDCLKYFLKNIGTIWLS